MTRLGMRHRDPMPWTWEPSAALVIIVASVLAWIWVAADLLLDWLTGTGVEDPINFAHIGDTLTSGPRLAVAATGTVLVLTATIRATRSHRWARATGRARTGFATAAQARAILGEQRLRAVASQIRPDLYPDQSMTSNRARRTRSRWPR